MSITEILFWFLTVLALGSAILVITSKNPVYSILSLIVTFFAISGHYILMNAQFLAIVNIIVYAGAIMVLFLFIIMLLDLRAEKLRKINWIASAGGVAVAMVFMVQVFSVIRRFPAAKQAFPPLARHVLSGVEGSTSDDVHRIGLLLFNNFNLPFQVIGIVILVATVGVIVLSRRETR